MHQDKLVFASADHLWQVSRQGGDAKALTKGNIEDRFPHFSPNGQEVAFMRGAQGNYDVYTLNTETLITSRLTNHPAADWPLSWSHDGKYVNLVSRRDNAYISRLYQVASQQGFASPLPTQFGEQMNVRVDGVIAYVPISKNPGLREFRHYRGGKKAEIHIVKPNSSGKWQPLEKISFENGNSHSPKWLDNTLYYIADKSGTDNLYRYVDGQSSQLTHFSGFGIRSYDVDHSGFVIIQDGQFHTMDLNAKQINRLTVNIAASDRLIRTRRINAAQDTSEFSLSNDGGQYVIVARGDVFLADEQSGKSENITKTPGVAERDATISPDGKTIAYFSDASGHNQLTLQSLEQPKKRQSFAIETKPSFYRGLTWSPDSSMLSFNDNRLKLWVFDRRSSQFIQVNQSAFSGQNRYYVSWSNDSRLLAYGLLDKHGIARIHIYDHDKQQSKTLSPAGEYSNFPQFDANGRYLYYFASLNANSTGYRWGVLNGLQQAARRTGKLKAVVLNQDDQPPTLPGLGMPNLNVDWNEVKSPVTIDFQGLKERTFDLAIGNHNIVSITAPIAGKILVLTQTFATPIRLDSMPDSHLFQLDLRNPTRFEPLYQSVDRVTLSSNGRSAFYTLNGNSYLVDLTDHKKPAKSLSNFDLFMLLDPAKEWRQMFDESYRFLLEQMYDPNLHGNDPKALYQSFARYLPNLSSRKELQYLIDRMMGFVSVSHIGVDEGDLGYAPSLRENIGLLGADFRRDQGRYQFSKVYRNIDNQSSAYAPLDQYASKVQAGEYLIKVNNQNVTDRKNLFRYFFGLGERTIFISVADNPQGHNARKLQVRTVTNESNLRVANWGEGNRRYIAEQSGGKIKYVHLYRFNQSGIQHFLTEYYRLGDAQGLIIDTRFNPGGITSDALIDLLSRKSLYKYRFRQGVDLSTPVNAFDGQTTLLTNQWNGSAAETFAKMFKAAKLGNIVGKPTFGAGIGPYAFHLRLVDGARIQVPNRGSYLPNGQWTIENRGMRPHFDVATDLYRTGPDNDPQLNKALTLNLEQIQNNQPQKWIEPQYPVHPDAIQAN